MNDRSKPASAPTPYRSTPVFDQDTLPAALQREHRTKPGVWGVVRVLEGSLTLTYVDPPSEEIVSPGKPGPLGVLRTPPGAWPHPCAAPHQNNDGDYPMNSVIIGNLNRRHTE